MFPLKRVLSAIFVLIIAGSIFGTGVYIGKTSVVCKFCQPENINFSLFWESLTKLQDKFVDPLKINDQEIIYGAISGMVKALEDPYTVFMSPDDTKSFFEDVNGRFEGVGMEVGIKKGQLQVISPLKGTPAMEAGMRAGDSILKIDDKLTSDLSIDEAVSLIRGPKGTEVTLTVFREGWNSTKEIKIKRAVIEIASLEWEMKGDIAYLQLFHFSEQANYDFSNAAIEIINSPAKKILLDLRNNPGGYLEVSQNIAGWFLEKGQIVTIEDFNGKKDSIEYKAQGNSKLISYPVVILINKGSASASEILAAALRDNRGIKLVGETSFGKGSVQELLTLSDGSTIKTTIANWLTPNGSHITGVGLEPDYKVEMTEDDYSNEKDPQLEKALEILNQMQ
jgi:carboxyl-terminal processing protease